MKGKHGKKRALARINLRPRELSQKTKKEKGSKNLDGSPLSPGEAEEGVPGK